MWPEIVILVAPAFKDDLRFEQAAEEFPVEALVAQLVMEALDVAVLPWAAGFDIDGFYLLLFEPVLDRVGDELRAIVTAQVARPAIALEGCLHHGDDIHGTDGPCGVDGEALARVLVEQCQDAEPGSVLGLVQDEVPASHVVLA